MRSLIALSVVALAAWVSGSSVFTVPITKLQRTGEYLKGAPDADRTRASYFKSAKNGPADVPATSVTYSEYTISIGVGDPATTYQVIVDTGSSNTFIGAGQKYHRTKTSFPTGEAVIVVYGTGYFAGDEYLDQVTVAPGLVIRNQSIGNAISSDSFDGVDGLVGFGPADLTDGTLYPDDKEIPTVTNNLVSQKLVEKEVLGVLFAPSTSPDEKNGALTFGGDDSSLYEGEVSYVPLTKTDPSSGYWGIDITKVTYGNTAIISKTTAGVVDTGTTLVLLADDFYDTYLKSIPGATVDNDTSLTSIPPDSIKNMQPLMFEIGGKEFTMDVNAQLIPKDQNKAWGGVSGKRYGVVSNMGQKSGQGLDFILGSKFLERYYSVFDAHEKRVGFAQTKYTFTESTN